MIEARDLVKRFGSTVAVDHLSFDVRPGVVTGFLGPNGSGKSTTMRLLLGLDRADGGTATFNGRRYRDLRHPLREVGSLLDASYAHPGRSARNHLRWMAASNGLAPSRVDEVIAMVGLGDVAGKTVGGFSLGMRQRLGLAAAMLGDPHTLVLDEPGNGLDPEGIRWIRTFLEYLAAEGRTVLVSSHLLAEMALSATQLLVIGRGQQIFTGTVEEFVGRFTTSTVHVSSPASAALAGVLRARGVQVSLAGTSLEVTGCDAPTIGEMAFANGIVLHELTNRTASLEEAFLEVTKGVQEYRSAPSGGPLRVPSSLGPPGSPLPPPPPPPTGPGQASPPPSGSPPAGSPS